MKNLLQIQLNPFKSTGFVKSGQQQKANSFFGILFSKLFKKQPGMNMYGFAQAPKNLIPADAGSSGNTNAALGFLKNMFAKNKAGQAGNISIPIGITKLPGQKNTEQDNMLSNVFQGAAAVTGFTSKLPDIKISANTNSRSLSPESAAILIENNPEFSKFKQEIFSKLSLIEGKKNSLPGGELSQTGLKSYFAIKQLISSSKQNQNETVPVNFKLTGNLQIELKPGTAEKPVTVHTISSQAARQLQNQLNAIQKITGEDILSKVRFEVLPGNKNQTQAPVSNTQEFPDFEKAVLSKLSLLKGTKNNTAAGELTQTGLKSYFTIKQLINNSSQNLSEAGDVKFKLTDSIQIGYNQYEFNKPVTVFAASSQEAKLLNNQFSAIQKITGEDILSKVRFEVLPGNKNQTQAPASNTQEFPDFEKAVLSKLSLLKGTKNNTAAGELSQTGLKSYFTIRQLISSSKQNQNETVPVKFRLNDNLQIEINQQKSNKPVIVHTISRQAAKQLKNEFKTIQKITGEDILSKVRFEVLPGNKGQTQVPASNIPEFSDFGKKILSKLSLPKGIKNNVSAGVLPGNKGQTQAPASNTQEFPDFEKEVLSKLSLSKGIKNNVSAGELSQKGLKSYFTIKQLISSSKQNQNETVPVKFRLNDNLQIEFIQQNSNKPVIVHTISRQAAKQLKNEFKTIQKITGEDILSKVRFEVLPGSENKKQFKIMSNANLQESTQGQGTARSLPDTLKEFSISEKEILSKLSKGLNSKQLDDKASRTSLKSYFAIRQLLTDRGQNQKPAVPLKLNISDNLRIEHDPQTAKKPVTVQVPDRQTLKLVNKQFAMIQKITGEDVLSKVRFEVISDMGKQSRPAAGINSSAAAVKTGETGPHTNSKIIDMLNRNDSKILSQIETDFAAKPKAEKSPILKTMEGRIPARQEPVNGGRPVSNEIPPLQRKDQAANNADTNDRDNGQSGYKQDFSAKQAGNIRHGGTETSGLKQETNNSFTDSLNNQIKSSGQDNTANKDFSPHTAARTIAQPLPETMQPDTQQKFEGLAGRIRETILKYDWTKNRLGLKANFRIENSPVGRMEIQFQEKGRKKSVQIYVESENAKAEIQKILPQVQQNLTQRAVNLELISVNVSSFSLSSEQFRENQRKRDKLTQSSQNMKEVQNEQNKSAVEQKNYGYNTIEVVA